MVKSEGRGGDKPAHEQTDDEFDQGGTTARGRDVNYDPDADDPYDPPATYAEGKARGKKGKAQSKATGKTVRDTKRGKAENDYQVPINGTGGDDDEGGGKGHNSRAYDGDTLAEAIELIEAEQEKIDEIERASRLKKAPHKETIKETIKSLRESNYPAKALGALLRKRKHLVKAANADAGLDDEGKKDFRALEDCLPDDANLFGAALRAEAADAEA
jgi:hypothetical protein